LANSDKIITSNRHDFHHKETLNMCALNFLNVWFSSMESTFQKLDIEARFIHPDEIDVDFHSGMNLRQGAHEFDLMTWINGEVELATGSVGGLIEQAHYSGADTEDGLAVVITRMNEFIFNSFLRKYT
jgi:hypothetical protein